MAAPVAGTPDQAAFLAELFEHGHLIDSGAPGVYGRGPDFERILNGFDDLVARVASSDGAEVMRFPPVLPRQQFEASGYLRSFPHLAGTIFSFEGTEQEALDQEEAARRHEDWSQFQSMTDLVLVPAACYPVYRAVGLRGPLPGWRPDRGCWRSRRLRVPPRAIGRSDPPADLPDPRDRLSGEPQTVLAWRDAWRERAMDILSRVGLERTQAVANDPFFGRTGRMLAANQRAEELKFELLVSVAGPTPTAVASFNYHQDHFTQTYGITMASGGPAHTACLGFGLERIVLALLRTHGPDLAAWPAPVRDELLAMTTSAAPMISLFGLDPATYRSHPLHAVEPHLPGNELLRGPGDRVPACAR